MDTANRNTSIWWIVGAIVALLLLWVLFRNMGNNNPLVPNTGVDDSASSTNMYNGASSTDPTSMNAKG